MTPAEKAQSTDPEVLRDTLKRATMIMNSDPERKRMLQEGTTEQLVQFAVELNSRLPRGRRVRHGLIPEID